MRRSRVLHQSEPMRPAIKPKAAAILVASTAGLPHGRPAPSQDPGATAALCDGHLPTLAADSKVRVFRASDHHHYNEVFVEMAAGRSGHHRQSRRRGTADAAQAVVGPLLAERHPVPEGPALVYLLMPATVRETARGRPRTGWNRAPRVSRDLFLTRSGGVAWLVEGRFLSARLPGNLLLLLQARDLLRIAADRRTGAAREGPRRLGLRSAGGRRQLPAQQARCVTHGLAGAQRLAERPASQPRLRLPRRQESAAQGSSAASRRCRRHARPSAAPASASRPSGSSAASAIRATPCRREDVARIVQAAPERQRVAGVCA